MLNLGPIHLQKHTYIQTEFLKPLICTTVTLKRSIPLKTQNQILLRSHSLQMSEKVEMVNM